VFEKRVLSKIFVPKWEREREAWRNCIMKSCMICDPKYNKDEQVKEGEVSRGCDRCETEEKSVWSFWWKYL
jgi:hypothetical protein